MSKWPMFWSDIMLVAFWSVTEVAYCIVKYIVGLGFHEKGWWPRPKQEVSLEGGQMHY
jgi:hypothetical protein